MLKKVKTQELPHVEEAFSNGNIKNWPEKALNYFNFNDFLDLKNLWNCNVMKFKTTREEKTISSLLPWGRKWFFPPSWSQTSWHCNFTSFSDKNHNFFFPVGLLLRPLGNAFLVYLNLKKLQIFEKKQRIWCLKFPLIFEKKGFG